MTEREFNPPPWAYDPGIHRWYDGETEWWFFPTFDAEGEFLEFRKFTTETEAVYEASRMNQYPDGSR